MQIKNLFYLLIISVLLACKGSKKDPALTNTLPPVDIAKLRASNQSLATNPSGQTPIGLTINPKHGEPGHRCDLPVGAPLNSNPVKAPTAVQQQVTMSKPTTVPVNATAKGMNPPHGQPNHRCDIAVGAPLDSKPGTATAATTTAPATPATVQPPASNASGQKLNPPHGQPNHRCDIAVGAPLT